MSNLDVLLEEFEVLEAIYPSELTKLSERHIQIDVEPDEGADGDDALKLTLDVHYPDDYPNVLPDLNLESSDGEFSESEIHSLIEDLKASGEENIGMAMTFTLVTFLKDKMAEMVTLRIERKQEEEREKERRQIEAEEARTRGTQVTVESFSVWKAQFDKEMATKKLKEEEERLKGLSAKEREEHKRALTRITGRQLFERNQDLDVTDDLAEEGTVSVDISQYDRERQEEKDEEDERITFSDEE